MALVYLSVRRTDNHIHADEHRLTSPVQGMITMSSSSSLRAPSISAECGVPSLQSWSAVKNRQEIHGGGRAAFCTALVEEGTTNSAPEAMRQGKRATILPASVDDILEAKQQEVDPSRSYLYGLWRISRVQM